MDTETAERLVNYCRAKEIKITTAESCTGGLISSVITDIPGASEVFDRGFVTYSNIAKTELLGIDAEIIEKHGAVSEETAQAMAHGAIMRSHADIAVAVTGVAGPGGGTPDKPVGLVFIAATARFGHVESEEHFFPGSRRNVREATVEKALALLYDIACHL